MLNLVSSAVISFSFFVILYPVYNTMYMNLGFLMKICEEVYMDFCLALTYVGVSYNFLGFFFG
jgi:hypothetical protein